MRLLATLVVLLGVLFVSTTAHAKGCKEVSDVVGEQQCTRYGNNWSIERTFPITFRFGLRYSELSTSGAQFAEDYKKKRRPKGYKGYAFDGESLGVPKLYSYGFDGGFTFFIVGQLYAGLDGGIGFSKVRSNTINAGQFTLTDDSGVDVLTFHGGAPLGYRIPLGRASIRGEMFLGFTAVSVRHDVSAPGVNGAPSSGAATAARWLVEPRIAADIWFTQHISFGAYGGVNIVDKGRVLGLSLTWHHRAFDGDMAFW